VRGSTGSTVRCSIDIEVTPDELALWWSGVRKHVGMAGRRPISEKAIHLAAFAFDRDKTTTLQQDMDAWNREAPEEWHFADYRAFRTAALKALEALNRPALHARVD
jgi:hypothetical protein